MHPSRYSCRILAGHKSQSLFDRPAIQPMILLCGNEPGPALAAGFYSILKRHDLWVGFEQRTSWRQIATTRSKTHPAAFTWTYSFFGGFREVFQQRRTKPAFHLLFGPAVDVAAAFFTHPIKNDLGIGEVARRKDGDEALAAFGMCAVATSRIVSAPPTNGSLTSPTAGSSKTHMPSHLYGLMTKIEFFMFLVPFC